MSIALTLHGTFPQNLASSPDELIWHLNQMIRSQGGGGLRLEITGRPLPLKWACEGCGWKGPESHKEGEFDTCPNCHDYVEKIDG